MNTPFQAGDILTVSWNHRRIRVLQTDAIETFYDVEMDEAGWVMARARTASYYRTSTRHLQDTASIALPKPFSSEENRRFRPDLPMRLFRHHDADWSDGLPTLIGLEDDFAIPAQEIVIIPFGSKGGEAKPVKVQVGGSKNLSLRAIVEAARSAQKSKCTDVKGVGLYRLGTVGGLPSYYLWGAIDRAGNAS
jgi:hypothetical protein